MRIKGFLIIFIALICIAFASCGEKEEKVVDNGQIFRLSEYRASDGNLYLFYQKDSIMLTCPLPGYEEYDAWKKMNSFVISERVEINGTIYPVTRVEDGTFYGCTNLRSITIPEGVKTIGSEVFINCSSLTSIVLPGSLEKLGRHSFEGCSGLTSLTVLSRNLKVIYGVFYGLDNITSLTLCCKEVGDESFNESSELKNVVLEEGVELIDTQAFYHCDKLTSIDLPSSLKTINSAAFARCPNLTDIYCRTPEVLNIEDDVFCWITTDKITLHVPSTLINAYKAHRVWGVCQNIVAI